jgi:hypothetical protein
MMPLAEQSVVTQFEIQKTWRIKMNEQQLWPVPWEDLEGKTATEAQAIIDSVGAIEESGRVYCQGAASQLGDRSQAEIRPALRFQFCGSFIGSAPTRRKFSAN